MNPDHCAFSVDEPCEASGEAGSSARPMKALAIQYSVGPRSAGAMAAMERGPTELSNFKILTP